MKRSLLFFIVLCNTLIAFGVDYYVSLDGDNANEGSYEEPFRTLQYAVTQIDPGDFLYMMGGTYYEASTITILAGNDGQSDNYKHIIPYDGETVILDFSSMPENSSNRGMQLFGNYWHIKDLIIQDAGDNGISVGGNHNLMENCIFRRNHDTGLQISRMSSSLDDIADWPSHNMIINCESYDNSDSDHEDADGFAAKLTCGPGNVFQNCVAHHNIDDGWDLYTKSETGPIGEVTLIACIAHNNGFLTDGSTSGNGDKNGFKLGGEDIAVDHVVQRCVAFNNGKHGFTYNRNLGSIEITNCSAYQNSERNYNFDGGTSVFNNNLSYMTGSNDRIIGIDMGNSVWDNDDTPLFVITENDFVSLIPGDNHAPYNSGFLQLAEGSQLIDKGSIIEGISFEGTAPDIGAFEYGGPLYQSKYILSVSIDNQLGGSVLISPLQSLYDSGTVVTLQAVTEPDYTFAGWTGDYNGTDTIIEITMDDNKYIHASFTTDKVFIELTSSGPGTVSVEPSLSLYSPGTVVSLSANADENGNFIGWSGDTISDENPLSFALEENMTVTGMFQFTPVEELIFQIENEICEGEGTVENEHLGYEGTGFFDFENSAGAHIQLSLDAGKETPCEVNVRYAMGKDEGRPMEIRVNDVIQLTSLDFPATGAWNQWDSISFSIELERGNNRIEFIALDSEGGVNFDQVRFSTADSLISKGYCDDGPVIVEEYTLSVDVSPADGGEVIIDPPDTVFEEGTLVNLSALPYEGFRFAGWSDGQDNASISLTMSADIFLTANFEEDPGALPESSTINNLPLSFRIFPNPASEYIILEISSAKESSGIVNLIDISGRIYPLSDGIIYFDAQNNFTFDLSGIASGWYILEIITEEQRVYEQLIIN